MSRKYEFTPEQVEAYTRHLKKEEAKAKLELAKQERHLNRIASKLLNAEVSLRKDIVERVQKVADAIGYTLPPRAARAAAPTEPREAEVPVETKAEKKSDWGWGE